MWRQVQHPQLLLIVPSFEFGIPLSILPTIEYYAPQSDVIRIPDTS